mgnify:CR=1 FL=1
MKKPILEVVMGVPLPGDYEGLKGIDLWGDGRVFNREESKGKETKRYTGTKSAAVAEKTGKFRIFRASPQFVKPDGETMSFTELVDEFGAIMDEESYSLMIETYQHQMELDRREMEPQAYPIYESNAGNPFMEKWYPIILENMKKLSVKRSIHSILQTFINNNATALSTKYPSTNVLIPGKMVDMILKASGIDDAKTPNAVSELLDALDAKTDFKSISKSPHQIIFTGMLIAATEMNDKALIDDMLLFVAFTIYPLIFRKYFPVTDPNGFAMEEALTVASKKFYITKTKNLLEWVRILVDVPYKFYREKFASRSVSDLLYVQFLNRVRNTMNQQFKSLYAIYKKAYDRRAIVKQQDGDFVTLGSNADKVQIYTMSITTSITDMGFRSKVCSSAAQYTKTPSDAIAKYVKEYMKHPKEYGLSDMVQSLLTVFFNVGGKNDFLAVMLKQYSKIWSSKDKKYADAKKYLISLEKKLTEFDDTYIHRHLFGVYLYFVILINISLNNISNKLMEISLSLSEK